MPGTVLFRRSALGDVVLLGAVTSQVEPPVTVVTDARWREVAAALRGVNAVLDWPDSPVGLPGGVWIDLQGSPRSRALTGRGAHRIDKRSMRRLARQWLGAVVAPRPTVPALYAEACGVSPTVTPWIDGSPAPRDTLALIPGAAWPTKQWSVEGFRQVAAGWDGPVVVLGGPDDDARCRAVAHGRPWATVCVERGFSRTLDWLRRTHTAVGGDTGLTHLAAACGARVVGLFLATHPTDGFWPYDAPVVQRDDLHCRPCTRHGGAVCPLGDFACQQLSPSGVIALLDPRR
jgi:hypothetical protein